MKGFQWKSCFGESPNALKEMLAHEKESEREATGVGGGRRKGRGGVNWLVGDAWVVPSFFVCGT